MLNIISNIQTTSSFDEKPSTENVHQQGSLINKDLQFTDYIGIFLLVITLIISVSLIVKVFSK